MAFIAIIFIVSFKYIKITYAHINPLIVKVTINIPNSAGSQPIVVWQNSASLADEQVMKIEVKIFAVTFSFGNFFHSSDVSAIKWIVL